MEQWIKRLTNDQLTLGGRKDAIDDQLALNLILEQERKGSPEAPVRS